MEFFFIKNFAVNVVVVLIFHEVYLNGFTRSVTFKSDFSYSLILTVLSYKYL